MAELREVKRGSLEWLLIDAHRAGEEGLSYDEWRSLFLPDPEELRDVEVVPRINIPPSAKVGDRAVVTTKVGGEEFQTLVEIADKSTESGAVVYHLQSVQEEPLELLKRTHEGEREPRCGKPYRDKDGDIDYCSFPQGHVGSCW
jgi:hypothetical protein